MLFLFEFSIIRLRNQTEVQETTQVGVVVNIYVERYIYHLMYHCLDRMINNHY